jgi:hypothetical protein
MSVQTNANGIAPADLAKTVELFNIDGDLQQELQRLAAINQELLGKARPEDTRDNVKNHLPEQLPSATDTQEDRVNANGNVEDYLEEELQRLAAINQELLGKTGPSLAAVSEPVEEADERARLQRDNAELRACIEVFEQALHAKAADAEPAQAPTKKRSWEEQQKEYEALLEEKSEVIRNLHEQIQELEQGASASPDAADNVEASSAAVDEAEVNRLKKQLEQQRARLAEDEEELMQQMRQMEMAMAKDRAELARQRTEIQRLQQALNHEIENASRDHGLRERLGAVQRLQGQVTGRKQPPAPSATAKQPAAPSSPGKQPPAPSSPTKQPAEPPPPAPAKPANGRLGSGVWRRVFGK